MKNTLIFILSFILVIGLACWCAPENNDTNNELSTPSFNYNIDYEIPKSSYQNQQSYNYDYSDMVYITRTGKCYHKAGCSHAKKSAGYMSRSQASNMGYRACSYCCY